MSQPHDIRGKRVLIWLGLFALIIAAMTVPDEWLTPLKDLLGDDEQTSAFGDEVATLDDDLEAGDARLTDGRARELVPHVVSRRLLRAGPMTTNQMRRAAEIWTEAMRAVADEPQGGSTDAHYVRAERRIVESFPRLDADRVHDELEAVRDQVARARSRSPGGGPGEAKGNMECAACHRRTRPLPEGRTFDVVGIYPFLSSEEAFDGGRRFPVLVESLELEALAKRTGEDSLGDAECLTCHVPHGADGFRIGRSERVENMGLWVNLLKTEPGVLHVEVKVKSADAGHRAPAGFPRAAYVTTVEAFQGGDALPPRFGQRLPRHLRGKYTFGSVFARHLVDANGDVTTRLDDVADLRFDSRLASGRFDAEHFVFDRRDRSPARVRVTLWYLPDYATWKGAVGIRRADKTEP